MGKLVGIDLGTSSVKAVLFDKDGAQLNGVSYDYEYEIKHGDWVEMDPMVYWHATQFVLKSLFDNSHYNQKSVVGIGVTSQGETLITLDSNGNPVGKAIVWLDNRAKEEANLIKQNFSQERIYKKTGQNEITPCWTACKILWIRRNEPDRFYKTKKFLLIADYIIYKLTGEFITDHAHNPSTLYYDIIKNRWWDDMLNYIKISPEFLPKLNYSGCPVGVLKKFGFNEHACVTTCPIDQVTGALGAGNLSSATLTETTGSAMAICLTTKNPFFDPKFRFCLNNHVEPGLFVLLPWIPTGGIILKWFKNILGNRVSYEKLEKEAGSVDYQTSDLIVLPHYNGAYSPIAQANAKGVIHGLTLEHTRGHLTLAIMEAIAFSLKENLNMLLQLDFKIEDIVSLGGGANSFLWLNIKAATLNMPIKTLNVKEVTCLGAALAASVASGIHSSFSEAVKSMVKMGRTVVPDPDRASVYLEKYNRYSKVSMELLKTFKE